MAVVYEIKTLIHINTDHHRMVVLENENQAIVKPFHMQQEVR